MTIRSTYAAHHRLVLGASVMVVAVAGVSALATSALFSETATQATGSFSSGTVILTAGPTPMTFPVPPMIPGQKVYAPITVTNTGTLDLRYSMSSVAVSSDAALLTGANAFNMTIQEVDLLADCPAAGPVVTPTALVPAVGPMDIGAAAALPIIGTIAQGQGGSDQIVLPGAPQAQILCVEIELPTAYTNQGQTASATFTFTGEQTKNNP